MVCGANLKENPCGMVVKAEHGERVSSNVHFGYRKSENDPKKWVIDEPAAEVVKRIYALCLVGREPSQIVRELEKEQMLIAFSYYESVSRKHSRKILQNPYAWDQKTVADIFENWRQYTGAVQSTSRSPPSSALQRIHYINTSLSGGRIRLSLFICYLFICKMIH